MKKKSKQGLNDSNRGHIQLRKEQPTKANLGITHFRLKLLNFMVHLSFPLKRSHLVHVLRLDLQNEMVMKTHYSKEQCEQHTIFKTSQNDRIAMFILKTRINLV